MNRLDPPSRFTKDVNIWIDEAIWGHRFYNDQTPWLVLLEFLSIFVSRQTTGHALNENNQTGSHEQFSYSIPRLIPLRELIFNNPHLQHIESVGRSDTEMWNSWLKQFNDDYDFSFLKERFVSFSRLARIVEFYQTTSVESHRQRRWSSKFIFPYGSNCLYADLPTNINGSPDRRFFARGGELLYLMLNRSGSGPEISSKISSILLSDDKSWNNVINALLPPDYDRSSNSVTNRIGYLPFETRPEYNELASTWLQLLDLDVPGEALLDPLMRLSSLHMLLYMLRRSNEEIGSDSEPKIVLEIASPKRTSIFELSKENFSANRVLSSRAVRAYSESALKAPEWSSVHSAVSPPEAARIFLTERFSWNPDDGAPSGDPETIFNSLRSYADKRHQQHVAKVHSEWSRQIGLSVSRRGAGTWYSPDDLLLKALVMCIVTDGREEYHRFLSKLYERFRLIVGVAEAEKAFGYLPSDQNAFMQNTQRLEQRLRTLGLLRRLSDDCAYVENPFGGRS